jgi:hypothetical protein
MRSTHPQTKTMFAESGLASIPVACSQ